LFKKLNSSSISKYALKAVCINVGILNGCYFTEALTVTVAAENEFFRVSYGSRSLCTGRFNFIKNKIALQTASI
jgi:hypothetical protein